MDQQGNNDNQDVVPQRGMEDPLSEHLLIVPQAHEIRRGAVAVPAEEAVVAGLNHRQNDKEREQRQRRNQKYGSGRVFPALIRPPKPGIRLGERPVVMLDMAAFLAQADFLRCLESRFAHCSDCHASSTVLAASSGVVAPAARSAEMSLTTRPTLAPRN